MKKIILVLTCLILCACSSRSDYYVFSFNDFSLTVGYDDAEFVEVAFDTNIKNELEANEVVKDIDVKFGNKFIGKANFTNYSDSIIESSKATLSKFTVFLKDIGDYTFAIDDIVLDKSIKKNCETFNGKYVENNGYACVIEKPVGDKNNSIIMYGDYLNIDQDELDHITISLD